MSLTLDEYLSHDICPYCYEWHDMSMGLIPFIMKAGCDANVVHYRRQFFTIRKFKNMIVGYDEMAMFRALLDFTHLKKMPNLDTATELDKRIYHICRLSDIRSAKRIKCYIRIEEQFDF